MRSRPPAASGSIARRSASGEITLRRALIQGQRPSGPPAGAIVRAREEQLATNGKTIVPPQNLEAEESVLGAMMVSGGTIEPVFLDVRLQPEDFYRDRHRTIFQAI